MKEFTETFDLVMKNEFMMSLIGIIIWFGLLYGAQSKMRFKEWFQHNARHIVLGFLVAFAIVAYDDDIVREWNKHPEHNITWSKLWYLGGGIWLSILYKLVSNINFIMNFIIRMVTKVKIVK